MISLSNFLAAVQQNRARVNRYESGGDGMGGKCDCIGLIIGAVRLAGGKWPWTHGSNYTARNRIDNLRPVSSPSDVALGELVFKAREPGESSYALPDTYKNSPDQRDYYHVGVVTSVSPFCITHCTSVDGGIQQDSKLGKWRFAGLLNLLDYKGDDPMEEALFQAVVHADNGYPVKMRSQPSTNGAVIASVPLGSKVDVLETVSDTWDKIRYDGSIGYMMSKFLRTMADDPVQDGDEQISRETLVELKACLVPLLYAIEKALNGGAAG